MQRVPTWAKVSILSCSLLLAGAFVWYKGVGERQLFGGDPGSQMGTSKSAGGARILPAPEQQPSKPVPAQDQKQMVGSSKDAVFSVAPATTPITPAGDQKVILTGSKSYSGGSMVTTGVLTITTTKAAESMPSTTPGTSTAPSTQPPAKPASK